MAKKYQTTAVNGKTYIETSGEGDAVKPLIFDDEAEGQAPEPIDALGLLLKVTPQLREEAKQHRLESKKYKELLTPFIVGDKDGEPQLFDLDEAKSALDVAKRVKQGELIDAGQRDKVIAGMVDEFKVKESALIRTHEEQLSAARAETSTWRQRHDDGKLDGLFAKSCANGFLAKTNLTPGLAKLQFGASFKFKDDSGDAIALSGGEPMYSKEKAGELASFEEAIQTLYGKWADGAKFMKGTADAGSGARAPGAAGSSASREDKYRRGLNL